MMCEKLKIYLRVNVLKPLGKMFLNVCVNALRHSQQFILSGQNISCIEPILSRG